MTDNPWLNVIGIGEDGLNGLGALSRSLVEGAEVIYGGERHLAMIPEDQCVKAERRSWPSPFSKCFEELEALRGKQVVVLASGDPMHFGIGGTLQRRFERREMRILSLPSSFSMAASRIGWPMDKCQMLTIHGRSIEALVPHYLPGARLLVLSRDGASPREVAIQLCERDAGETELIILEHLGGKRERIIETNARALAEAQDETRFADLNLLAIALPYEMENWLPLVPGLPDEAFEHDGKMTKREIRATALAKLAPRPNALLWDIGAGCGSVAIEWLRMHPTCRAIGFEPLEKRRAFAQHNARMLGVPHLQLVDGRAPDVLHAMERPDAVFLGGGLSEEVITYCLDALKNHGHLVAHAVTLGSERLLTAMFEQNGGELTRIEISKATPVGPLFGWRPAMPVTQWTFTKQ
ncbi:precorrin-6y C5,15-methyltransferase (decarboxylating) subunit CbiE [uncultured Cohaesibacter sp.]|uniref:precorrin-6y C5,15-methyltransferase (decarboxylating) subunit CbiE n=1 Tax=uncultured Cohaesibacter sp. TaxID=1002546 RepID=UPI002931B39C|nr:precorrin-6y C5,15-methyltransferase (decarboxylating) subunit CbiE [uncultured Cohaesibacter sp.]